MGVTSRIRTRGRRRRNRPPTPGAAPGGLPDVDGTLPSSMRVMAYGPERLIELAEAGISDVTELRASSPVVWVDIVSPAPEVMRGIGELLGLHPLALEDVMTPGQRPKLEEFTGPDHLFLMTALSEVGDSLDFEQMGVFLGPDYVVTVQERPGDCFDRVRERIRHERYRIRRCGPDYLAYALLDAVVDQHLVTSDLLGARLEGLEDDVFRGRQADKKAAALFDLRQDLLRLRRVAASIREVHRRLLDDELPGITDDTRLYLRDAHDHAIRLVDQTEHWREYAANLMEMHLAVSGQELNQVMRVLTIITTIFVPLTFIAGIYGMNFQHMPELQWAWGYPAVPLLMAAVGALLVALFRRRGWF